jgi:alpha-glucosidase
MKKNESFWWKEAVIYQIYPRSFNDSNNDGVGDIPGIIEKLDYLKDLGVDALWLSPVFPSPMHDFGYDITDYKDIDPLFGTLNDAKKLIKEAHKRDIRILFDMVMNHTSSEHPWFLESRSSKDNDKRDWYLWQEGAQGKVPNNWLASFGGKAWEYDEATKSYYYHAFLKEQPDLNWFNPEVREEIYNIFRFWMDLGVDGFRLDVVNYYVKDQKRRNNPWTLGSTPRPYDMQKHLYDRDRPEMYDFLRELRQVTDEYSDIMMVGETYTEPPGDPLLSAACMGNGEDMLHMAFDFSMIFTLPWSGREYNRILTQWYNALPAHGWPSLVMSNHDQSRIVSRLGCSFGEERAKIAAALLLTAKGTPFMYYGDELGLSNVPMKKSELFDPPGIKYWPFYKGRDPFRTPMPWDSSEKGGFSRSETWLPLNKDYRERNVQSMEEDQQSIFNVYRDVLNIRRKSISLRRGEYIPIVADRDVLCYYRTMPEETTTVFLNFSARPRIVLADDTFRWKILYASSYRSGTLNGLSMHLEPHEILIMKRIF